MEQRAKKQYLEVTKATVLEDITVKEQEFDDLQKVAGIIKEVGLATQQQLQIHIGDITSLALDSVFGDEAYALAVNFVERRNQTECDLFFQRGGQDIEPTEASGYGAVDVAALALRVASWAMLRGKSRNIIILDEPLRFLSENYQEAASKMLHKLSQMLNLQFIIVTHEEELVKYADKVFSVSQVRKDGYNISKIASSLVIRQDDSIMKY